MTDSEQNLIERIQEQAIRLIGRDPVEIRAQIARENAAAVDLTKNMEQKIDLDAIRLVYPEKLYGTEEDILERFEHPRTTHYDRPQFISRFFNLDEVCHRFLSAHIGVARRDIRIASLPFLKINGVCAELAEDRYSVFLNEGLLYGAPGLLEMSAPIFRIQTILREADGSKGARANADAEVSRILTENLDPFLLEFLMVMEGKVNPYDMRDDSGPFRPHAWESWNVSRLLRDQIQRMAKPPMDTSGKRIHDVVTSAARNNNDERQRHLFYAARGFFLYILAHEFSHAYRAHSRQRQMGACLRPLAELEAAADKVREEIGEPGFTAAKLARTPFAVTQPTETEADADALRCVVHFFEENDLPGTVRDAVVTGALSPFIYMELMERIASVVGNGLELTESLRWIDPDVRNAALGAEHPTPLSRPLLALRHAGWGDHQAKPFIESIWQDMRDSLETVWDAMAMQLAAHLERTGYEPAGIYDRAGLFASISAVGCFDQAPGR